MKCLMQFPLVPVTFSIVGANIPNIILEHPHSLIFLNIRPSLIPT